MRIEIEINKGLFSYVFIKNNKQVNWEDLSQLEQIVICNGFANGCDLFSKNIKKPDEK